MIFIKPSFYDDFKCTSSKCTDNCCIGWEIDVDDEALSKYRNISGDFGERIKASLISYKDGSTCFRLLENERCAFLNNDNLCDIIINCGENSLCDICREHPRFYEWFPGVTECGLGLCCEEACRLLIEKDGMFSLEEYNDGEEINFESKDDIIESDTYIVISGLRELFFEILSDSSLRFSEKLVKILEKTERFTGEKCKIKNDKALVEAYSQTEPIDDNWTVFVENLKVSLEDILPLETDLYETENDEYYSKILAYILYRHLIKSVFDGGVAQRVCFCIESVRFIMLCDKYLFLKKESLNETDYINNLKKWSKQVEYSEENTDFLIFGEVMNG